MLPLLRRGLGGFDFLVALIARKDTFQAPVAIVASPAKEPEPALLFRKLQTRLTDVRSRTRL